MSTLSLAKNGYVSSSKRTKHIKAKYFFIRHFHKTGELNLQYCPTEQMWADVLTKPLQGAKFRLMRAFLMNCPLDNHEDPILNPTDTPTSNPTVPSPTKSHKSNIPFVPTNEPTNISMKHRSLRPTPSSRGCVETQSQGTNVPGHAYEYTPKNVTCRDALFPRRRATPPSVLSSISK